MLMLDKIANKSALYLFYFKTAAKLVVNLQFRELKEKVDFFFTLKRGATSNGSFVICDSDEFSGEYLNSTQVAVHLHVHYPDVAKVLLRYLKNIPVRYDLLVSVTDAAFEADIRREIERLSLSPGEVLITPVENRGRNVAPLVVSFAQTLQKYRYFCHIHTKKSLYTGRERSDWLKYLATALLGSRRAVGRILTVFDSHPDVGIIYPQTYAMLPYWAHTWLSNKGVAQQFFSRLGISVDLNGYLDAPMGTMFWGRVESLEPLLAMGLGYHDFPPEEGQNDGTLAHVIERALVPIVKSKGYTFCEIGPKKAFFTMGNSNRNLHQYQVKNKKEALNHLLRFDLLSFDIFDTLLLRPILDVSLLPVYVERLLRHRLKLDIPFAALRHQAESQLRKGRSGGDVTLDEIYAVFAGLSALPADVVARVKEVEVAAELTLAVPREDVVEIFTELCAQGKELLLVSDMYLGAPQIQPLLTKAKVQGYRELLVSSETGLRKDNGEFWRDFKDHRPVRDHIHVGDNEHSDIQVPKGLGINSYHMMSARNLFINSPFWNSAHGREGFEESVLLGLAANKVFGNPFSSDAVSEHREIKRLDTLGYFVFGPIFARFTVWLARSAKERGVKRLSFLSREGYLLKDLFEVLLLHLAGKDPYYAALRTDYLLVSRRATGVAAIRSDADIYEFLQIPFRGTVGNLLAYRYGLENAAADGSYLDTVHELEGAREKLRPYFPAILENAAVERESYLAYLESKGGASLELEAVVDAGYSGTIQKSLEKLLNRKLNGYYIFTTEKAGSIAANSCFGLDRVNGREIPLSRNLLFLESVMLAPDAQLKKFQGGVDGPQPVFREKGEVANFPGIEEVQGGIRRYLQDLILYYGDIVLDFADAAADPMQTVFERIIEKPELLSPAVRRQLLVEDFYTSALVRPVFPV